MPSARPAKAVSSHEPRFAIPLRVWWFLWLGAVAGAVVICFVFVSRDSASAEQVVTIVEWTAMILLVLSVVVRWLVLPLCRRQRVVFACFLVGLALSEAAAVLAALSRSRVSEHLFYAGLLGILQFVPLFSLRTESSIRP